MQQGLVMRKGPGPKKIQPVDKDGLLREVFRLRRRRKKSYGTNRLYDHYKGQVSRRNLNRIVKSVRGYTRQSTISLRWHGPGVAWSMDDTEFKATPDDKWLIHHVCDLASKYKFPPLVARNMPGAAVAKNLENLFKRYGPPLILKRDNGSNLNSVEVNTVLRKNMVIPLNSPGYYPAYNGSIEEAQKELKGCLRQWPSSSEQEITGELTCLSARLSAHDLNHAPRRCLSGRTSCSVFFDQATKPCFSKRQRKEIQDWIINRAACIIAATGDSRRRSVDRAWRMAVKMWLHSNGYLTVIRKAKVLPDFDSI